MDEYARFPFDLEQGQHVAVIGDTGTGKTTIVQAMLEQIPHGEYVIALRSKADTVGWPGFQRVKRALPSLDTVRYKRLLLEPSYDARHYEFSVALDRAYRQGGWTVFIDDLFNVQKLGPPLHSQTDSLIDQLLTMGRSKGNSVITAMQRPTGTTRYAIGEARLTISFMMGGRDALDIMKRECSEAMSAAIQSLAEHDIAMYWRPTREVWVGRLNLATGVFEGATSGQPSGIRV